MWECKTLNIGILRRVSGKGDEMVLDGYIHAGEG